MKKNKVAVMLFTLLILTLSLVWSGLSYANEKIEICYIPICTGIPYFDPIIEGMKTACEELGTEFAVTAPDIADPTSQIPYIKAQIQKNVDAICISPNSVDTLLPVLDEARNKGIKIIMVNDDITGNEDHRDAAVLSTDYERLARDCFAKFAELMGNKGKFVVISSTTDAPFQNNQIKVYKEMLNDPKYKDMELLEILYGNDEPVKSLTEAEVALQKYPELDGILAPTSVAVVAAARAIENAGMTKDDIVVYGTGTPSELRSYIKEGIIEGGMLWDTYRAGYVAGWLAVNLAKGALEIKEGVSFNVPRYGEITVGPNNTVYAGPPLVFNKENVDDYSF